MRHHLLTLLPTFRPANLLHAGIMSEVHVSPPSQISHRALDPEPGRSGLVIALALLAACGTAVLALLASKHAEPVALTVMAALATVGIFFLFALAARHVRIGQVSDHDDLLRAMLDADDTGLQITDASGRVIAHNRAFEDLAGTNALGEVNALEMLLAADPAGAELLFRLSRGADRGEASCGEVRLPSLQGGAERWLRLSVKPITSPRTSASGSGPAALRAWRLVDISDDRERQAETLRSLETRLSHYARAPLGLMSVDSAGRLSFMNERLATWLGYPADGRQREMHVSELVADGAAHLVTAGDITGNPAPRRIDLDLVTEGGRRWPATLIAVPQGDRISIAVLERGVEAQPGVITAGSQEQRFSRFFQSAPFGIAAVDAGGRIVNANTAFARLVVDGSVQRGSNLVELLAKAGPDVVGQIRAVLDAARDGKANIAPFDITLGVKGKELTRKVYAASVSRSSTSGEVAILYILDATEAKALEHKFAQSQKLEAVGTLAGGIAHDFNNVLTAIIGFSDLLLQTHKPGHPSYAHILSIKSSANRAAGLVRQLLAFSRRQTLQPKVLQMGDVLTDLSMLVNRLLGEKIELKIVSGRDLWLVKADPSEIERTIINLAVNARDAMLPKGGRLTLRTRNIGERESQKLEGQGIARGEYVMIEVEDTGVGMTQEIMAKIFEPFFTTKAVGKGTGLGLASVYGIVQQTGGYIVPESTLGEGTTFRLYLPRHQLEPEEEIEPTAAAKKPRPRDLTGTGRVLLVEDEDAVRRFAVAALKSKGYEVLQAGDGVEAIEVMKANGNRVDIVVSDVIMPEMDGPTLMRELRKTDPKLKFIFVSGYPDDAFKNNLDPDAEYTFLPKPYSLAQIAAKVKEQIEQ